MKKIAIFIQNNPNETLSTFVNELKISDDVLVQTATEGTITDFEKQNVFTKFPKGIYIGDEGEYQLRIETAGGIFLSTTDIKGLESPDSYTRPIRLSQKLRKLNKWGLNLNVILKSYTKH